MISEDYKIAYGNVMIANKMLEQEIERLNNIIKEAIEYIKSIPDDEFVESEHFTELLFIFGKVGSDKE